ncbi:hypothetical protein BDV23DRAFT_160309 [Aspergillus alliaceus]|uniref:Uncharacterized protein n=1 Tax=Petromyces alliaceus TaxID=209559 RepID=A0A5N7C157_PETAA|nr:hypothetical protein BDV23DRAFT_160309 [Aspergillus alliaceus]
MRNDDMFLTWPMKSDPAFPPSDSDASSLEAFRPKVRSRNGCNTCRRRQVECDGTCKSVLVFCLFLRAA